MSLYIGVYKAIYDYTAQAPEELSLHTDDLLYLLERSDVDDWWKVKKRVLPVDANEVDEPEGLVPANYIEEAPVISHATALYDYTKQTEEELSFAEGERFSIYDNNDPDWILVGQGPNYGFVPANYIEIERAPQPTPAVATQAPSLVTAMPPPQHPMRQEVQQKIQEQAPLPREPEPEINVEDDDIPPPMPQRPREERPREERPTPTGSGEGDEFFDGEYFTWNIDEVDGRKKRPVVLSIGQGQVIIRSNHKNPKKGGLDQKWRVRDLASFSNEKKHVFLELRHPSASVELHTGTKDVAEAIVSILGDLKGAETASGLAEVASASRASTSGNNRTIGRLMYDFVAQGSDELSCREGDEVYVVSKSKQWWVCENKKGRQGVVPADYIEVVGTSNLNRLTGKEDEDKKVKKSRSVQRRREERDKIREKDRVRREARRGSREQTSDMPNYHRVRTWIDSSGSFKVEAEFLGFVDGKIHLHKTNGVKIAVGAAKLSVEDLEYVEKMTDTSLESYKDEVAKQNLRRKGKAGVGRSATAAISDTRERHERHEKKTPAIPTTEPTYDWFEFFLSCGVEIGNCQRYSLNFSREQMDENVLEDITPSLLRTLGLREGDIIRVMKFLDDKYNRKREEPAGPLFTNPTGALKVNGTQPAADEVNADALRKFEDDAWAIKPAARSSENLREPKEKENKAKEAQSAPVTPQYTGTLQDLVNIKPDSNKPDSNKPMPALPTEPSAPALTAKKTNNTTAKPTGAPTGGLVPVNTGGLIPVNTGGLIPVNTGGLIPVTTGGLIPVTTGGIMYAQPTGFMPITAQPTGFMPIQKTGMSMQKTGDFNLVQPVLQAGNVTIPQTSFNQAQKTGGFVPQSSFGQQMTGMSNAFNQTSSVPMPPTSFGQQQTGPSFGQAPGASVFGQVTGGQNAFNPSGASVFGQQTTGGQNAFGQITGGQNAFNPPGASVFGQQTTGGQNAFGQGMPVTSFGQPDPNTFGQPGPNTFGQVPNGQQTGFGQPNPFGQQQGVPTGGFSNNLFGTPNQPNLASQPSFGQQMNQMTNMFQNTSIQPNMNTAIQPNMFQNTNTQPNMNMNTAIQPNMFQNTNIQPNMFQNNIQQPNTFGQNSFGQPNTSFGQPSTSFGQPNTSFGQPFGQPQFDGFGSQPLQSQPTGVGFGNAPLQTQPTGRRANIQSATPDNPFGF